MRIFLKLIGIAVVFISIYIIEMLVFLSIYGEGSQASAKLSKGSVMFFMNMMPFIITGYIAYRIFRNEE